MSWKNFIKLGFKIIMPQKIYSILKNKKLEYNCFKEYKYDFQRYINYSDTKGSDTSIKLIGKIIREYHVIEKGLTMPQSRLGFGKELLISLCGACIDYITKYGTEDEQLKHALGVIFEYKHFHDIYKYSLDSEIVKLIEDLNIIGNCLNRSPQIEITKKEFFSNASSPFLQFSNSRSSVRNFSNENVAQEILLDILELARNTPSACNRQAWRTYIYSNKEQIDKILEIQGGNRGFGHLTNKLIVISGELGLFCGISERNQVFIDGGMYAMNLLYALQYYQIAACILNCSNSIQKDKQLRDFSQIKESEVFIAMVACGIPPDLFMIAASKRYGIDKTNKILN